MNHPPAQAQFQLDPHHAAPALGNWMKALIDYVRSGEPDLTNRQMALLMLVYLETGPHTVRGLVRARSTFRSPSSRVP